MDLFYLPPPPPPQLRGLNLLRLSGAHAFLHRSVPYNNKKFLSGGGGGVKTLGGGGRKNTGGGGRKNTGGGGVKTLGGGRKNTGGGGRKNTGGGQNSSYYILTQKNKLRFYNFRKKMLLISSSFQSDLALFRAIRFTCSLTVLLSHRQSKWANLHWSILGVLDTTSHV